MQQKFFKNLLLLVFLNLLVKPIWVFGIDLEVQNIVGTEIYGLYFSLLNFSILFTIILDFGIANFNNREIAQSPELLKDYLRNISGIKIILGIVYLLLCTVVALTVGYDKIQMQLLLLILLNQFIHSFNLYLRSNLSGLQYFKQDSFLSVFDKTFIIIICSLLIWGNISEKPFTIELFIYAQTVSYSLTFIAAFLLVIRKSGFILPNFNRDYFKLILRRSLPFALLSLLMGLYYRVDSVMLERLLINGKAEAGLYAQSFRILDTLNMIPFLFASLLLPIFSKMLANKENINSLTGFSLSLVLSLAIAIVFPVLFYSEEILQLLYDDFVPKSGRILMVLILSFLCISVSYIFGTLLTSAGELKFLNRWALVGTILNIGLNLLLIQSLGAFGCAVSSLATQMLIVIIQVIYAFRIFRIPLKKNLIVKLSILLISVLLTNLIVKNYFDFSLPIFILLLLSNGVLAFITKNVNLKMLVKLISS